MVVLLRNTERFDQYDVQYSIFSIWIWYLIDRKFDDSIFDESIPIWYQIPKIEYRILMFVLSYVVT